MIGTEQPTRAYPAKDNKDMKKALLTLTLITFGALAAIYAGLFYVNNRASAWPDQVRISASFAEGVDWLGTHREEILGQNNPALWQMVQQSAELTQDPSLLALFADYRSRYLERGRNIWLPLFYPGRWVSIRTEDTANMPDYNLHFVYAISCDPELAQQPLVQAQLSADYCDRRPWSPACATHQLMGFRFMQRGNCGDPQATEAAVSQLQTRITQLLTWDPRVVDVYLQRVLMLVESGAKQQVKPVWLDRVLDAQLADGGWSGTDPLISLPGSISLGFDARGLTLENPRSGFHATAQGVLLMSLLTESSAPSP